MAEDIRFVFPASSSLACDVIGKDHVAAWLWRLTALGPTTRYSTWSSRDHPGTPAPRSGCVTPSKVTPARACTTQASGGKIILGQLLLDTEIVAAWDRECAEPVPPLDQGTS